MRIAIVTRADNTIREMTDITHPIMRKYAEKIGADFIILNENKGLHHHYRILQLYELFDTYDRIISMDSDVLLTPDCPNLFEVVPEDKIGTVYEDIYSRKYDRRIRMAKAQEKFGELHWIGGYVNSGCMVFSKCHKDLFAPGRELYMDLGYDDVYLGYWIVKLDYKVYNFSLKFNYMHHFDEGGTNRLYAYVIHYAGQGFTGDRMGDLKRDYLYFYGDPPYPQMKNQAIIDEIGEAESVADIGCGEGFLTNWFIKHYPKVYAVDIKDDNRMNLKVLIGDLTEPETFPIKEVEVSVVSEVLEHIRWWKEALDTLTKITTRKIIITVPYGESFFEAGHVNFWDDESVKEFARDGWSLTIKKILTKPEDIKLNQLLYLICLTKK